MLLTLHDVTKRYPRGRRGAERLALRSVSLDLAAGDCVVVWGPQRSGRTTLLEICAGMELPSAGRACFGGHDIAESGALGALGGIGYAHQRFSRMYGVVVEQVAVPLMRSSVSLDEAQSKAATALERVGAADCSELSPDELEPSELVRVAIARAIVTEPRLLLIDAPTAGLSAPERDRIVELLYSLSRREQLCVLMTVDEIAGYSYADRVLSIHNGELRGDAVPAPGRVVELRPGRAEPSA